MFAPMKGTKTLIWMAAIAIIMTGCEDKNKWKRVDVSKITASVQTLRFEQDLHRIDSAKLSESESALRAKYGSFYDDYVLGIMGFGAPASKLDTVHHDYHIDLLHFLDNKSDRDLYDSVQLKYKDVSDIEAGVTDAVKHFKYYFPDRRPVTKVYTFISEFANGAITYGDTVIGIGLDMYLGEQYPYYESVGFPVFMKKKLKRDYIVPNAVEVLYNLHFDKTAYNAELPLIEGLINEGRKYYFMECMMPEAPDSLLIGYTASQEEWCRASEKSIWQYFNEHDLLYKVNFMDQKRYTTDGPTTAGMPAEAPAKVGSWVGWQIVRRFMKNSGGKVTLNDLLTKYSAKEIFAKANYKPK
jgi:hypothetical protein